jgi:hypothetical protein
MAAQIEVVVDVQPVRVNEDGTLHSIEPRSGGPQAISAYLSTLQLFREVAGYRQKSLVSHRDALSTRFGDRAFCCYARLQFVET